MEAFSNREMCFWFWLARRLPKSMLYFCFMQVMALVTTGKHGNTVVPDLTGMEAIKRFADDYLS